MSAPDENDLPDEEIKRMWNEGMEAYERSRIEKLDNLIHHPRLTWVPRLLTGWVCDLWDHKLGMSWDEIRRTRHGKQNYWQRYWGFDQVRTFSANSATSTIPGAKVTYKQVDR